MQLSERLSQRRRPRNGGPGAEYLSVREVARKLSVGDDTVRRWIVEQGLPAIRIGKLYRIDARELDSWLRARRIVEGEGQ